MAEDKKKQIEEQLQDEQLDEVNGGGNDNQELEKRLDRIEKNLRQKSKACF